LLDSLHLERMNELKDGLKNELETLAKDTKSGIKIYDKRIHLAMLPNALGKQNEKVQELLQYRLYKYHRDFDGILLYFEDLKVMMKTGGFHLDYNGFPHLDVRLKAYVFRPQRGIEVTCKVFKSSTNNLACRLFDQIYITAVKSKEETEIFNSGDIIKVEITDVLHHNHNTRISANFLSVISKAAVKLKTEGVKSEGEDNTASANKKIVFNDSDSEGEEAKVTSSKRKHDNSDVEEGNSTPKAKKKKSKKCDHDGEHIKKEEIKQEAEVKTEPLDPIDENHVVKKKKKKK